MVWIKNSWNETLLQLDWFLKTVVKVFQEAILNGQKGIHQVNIWFALNFFLIKFQLKSTDNFDFIGKLNENPDIFFHVLKMIAETDNNKITFHHTDYSTYSIFLPGSNNYQGTALINSFPHFYSYTQKWLPWFIYYASSAEFQFSLCVLIYCNRVTYHDDHFFFSYFYILFFLMKYFLFKQIWWSSERSSKTWKQYVKIIFKRKKNICTKVLLAALLQVLKPSSESLKVGFVWGFQFVFSFALSPLGLVCEKEVLKPEIPIYILCFLMYFFKFLYVFTLTLTLNIKLTAFQAAQISRVKSQHLMKG